MTILSVFGGALVLGALALAQLNLPGPPYHTNNNFNGDDYSYNSNAFRSASQSVNQNSNRDSYNNNNNNNYQNFNRDSYNNNNNQGFSNSYNTGDSYRNQQDSYSNQNQASSFGDDAPAGMQPPAYSPNYASSSAHSQRAPTQNFQNNAYSNSYQVPDSSRGGGSGNLRNNVLIARPYSAEGSNSNVRVAISGGWQPPRKGRLHGHPTTAAPSKKGEKGIFTAIGSGIDHVKNGMKKIVKGIKGTKAKLAAKGISAVGSGINHVTSGVAGVLNKVASW